MVHGSYRMKDPTLAISEADGSKKMLTVPAGTVITVDHPTGEPDLVDVLWNGRHVLMFATDLKLRGEMVPTQAA